MPKSLLTRTYPAKTVTHTQQINASQANSFANVADNATCCNHHHTTTVLWPFFQDRPGEPLPEENFWTLWCKGRLTEADTLTIRLGAIPYGPTNAYLHHPPILFTGRMPFQASCRPANSIKALKATTYKSSAKWCPSKNSTKFCNNKWSK